jgi:5-methylcytosine-specific restriction endonuclease McrA
MKSPLNVDLASERDILRGELFREQDGRCWLCDGLMVLTGRDGLRRPDACTVDHVQPKILGGKDERSNYRAAHRRCNNIRGHQTPEFAREIVKDLKPKRGQRSSPAMPFTRQWLLDKGYIKPQPGEMP